uniref:Solute carrier family 2, facilitated glucose transporter member 5 n=1 Tax=Myripristis murdjan TaxID=586833 RepID=A0A667XIG5_9TELE
MCTPENNFKETENTKDTPGDTKTNHPQPRVTVCLLTTAFFTAFGSSFLYGYNLSVVNAASPFVRHFMNRTWIERYGTPIESDTLTLLWSITVSIMAIGGLCGAIANKHLLKVLGRRGTLLASNCFSLVAAVLQATGEKADSFEMIIIGRFIIGINTGISLSTVPIYLGEIAPRHIRGSICHFHSNIITMGVVIGQILGLPEVLGQESRWNFLFAFIALPPLSQLTVLSYMPESPRYLLIDKKDVAGAEIAFKRFLGKDNVTTELEEAQAESQAQNNVQTISVLGILRSKAVRWQIITVIISVPCNQFSGGSAVRFHSYIEMNRILSEAGLSKSLISYMTIGVGGCFFLSAFSLQALVIEHVGRKPLLIVGFSGMAVFYSLTTVFINIQCFIYIHIYIYMYIYLLPCCKLISLTSLSAATLPIVVTELFEQSYRPAAFLIFGTAFWLCNFIMGLVFPFMQEALDTYTFLVFVVVCATVSVYLFIVLPETKNRTFMEISQSFAKRNKVSNVPTAQQELPIPQETQTETV